MSEAEHPAANRKPGTALVAWLARRIACILAEFHRAGRRSAELRTSVDRYLAAPAGAPDTYQEFLFRTSGVLAHEPSARERADLTGRRPDGPPA